MLTGEVLSIIIDKNMNKEEAAKRLGISRNTLYLWLKENKYSAEKERMIKEKLGIDFEPYEYLLAEEQAVYLTKKLLTYQDIANMVRRIDATTQVSLSAIAEVLAKVNGLSVMSVRSELEDAVNKQLANH